MFLTILNFVLQVIVWVMPNWRLPYEITDAFGLIISNLATWNTFIPIETFLYCISFILGFEIAVTIIKVTSGFISLLRGGGNLNV